MNGKEKEIITLESIVLEKEKKLSEIRNVRNNICNITKELIGPKEKNKKGIEGLMNNISTGFVIYDGIKMGLGIMKRIRRTFGVKK